MFSSICFLNSNNKFRYVVTRNKQACAVGDAGGLLFADDPGVTIFNAVFHRVLVDRIISFWAEPVKAGEAVFWPFSQNDYKS